MRSIASDGLRRRVAQCRTHQRFDDASINSPSNPPARIPATAVVPAYAARTSNPSIEIADPIRIAEALSLSTVSEMATGANDIGRGAPRRFWLAARRRRGGRGYFRRLFSHIPG